MLYKAKAGLRCEPDMSKHVEQVTFLRAVFCNGNYYISNSRYLGFIAILTWYLMIV